MAAHHPAQRRHGGALPAYLRIAEHLTIEIGAGRMAAGDRLPTEREMAARHGVSLATLRKALSVVTERGLIERRQGSGNFVRAGHRNVGTYALFRLEAVTGGGLPTAELLDLERRAKPQGLPDIGSDHPEAWRIRRRRALDGTAVAIEEIWLDGRFGPLKVGQLSESLYKTYAEVLDLRISQAEDRVSVAALPRWATGLLPGANGDAMGLVERRSFDHTGTPAEWSQSWFDPARARYYARVP